jgi:anti-sigma factor ChrR (cupin superfamily)
VIDLTGKHDMANDEIHEVASLYSLGLLEPELAAGFERHLDGGCAVCESEVRGFNEAATQVLTATELAEPPARLRDELMRRISQSGSKMPPASVIARADAVEWQDTDIPGFSFKQLFVDDATGNVTSLIRMAEGTTYPPHRHSGMEHCYVLEGDLVFDDHTLHSGDYEVAYMDTDHSPVTTKAGCLLLIINNQNDQLLA